MAQDSISEWLYSFKTISQTSERPRLGKTISVTSGKGGVGKSSISIKLAKILSDWGHKVLLVDCDYNLSNTGIKLGLPLDNKFYQLYKKEREFSECLHVEGNFHLLSACNGNMDFFSNKIELDKMIIEILIEQEKKFDFIILDCPAGLGREVLTLNAYTDYRFVVINPDKSSLTDSYSLIKILKNNFGVDENHVLVNMITSFSQYQRIIKGLGETVENFLNCRLKVLGWLPREEGGKDLFNGVFLKDSSSTFHKNLNYILQEFADNLSIKKIY